LCFITELFFAQSTIKGTVCGWNAVAANNVSKTIKTTITMRMVFIQKPAGATTKL
jgi:hypothetical protein